MRKGLRIILLGLVCCPPALLITACDKAKPADDRTVIVPPNPSPVPPGPVPPAPGPEPVPPQPVPSECTKLDQAACAAETAKCRYLTYVGKPTEGLCVEKTAKEANCKALTPDRCELENYLPQKCQKTIAGGCEDFSAVTKKTVKEVFALSANFAGKAGADLDASLNEFNKAYKTLDAAEKKSLAEEEEAGQFLIHRLVNIPTQLSTYNVVNELADDLGADFNAQMKKKLAGSAPLVLLTLPTRVGDQADDYKNLVTLFVSKGADINELPVANLGKYLAGIEAASSQARMKTVYDTITKDFAHLYELAKFSVDNMNVHLKAAFTEAFNAAPDVATKNYYSQALLTAAVDKDKTAGSPGDAMRRILNDDWLDTNALKSNILVFGAAGAQGKFPVGLSSYLKVKNGNNPLTDLAYLEEVNGILKAKMGDADWTAFIADPAVTAGVAANVAGANAGIQNFNADLALHKDVVTQIWNNIKARDLAIAADVTAIDTDLQKLFTLVDNDLRSKLITQMTAIAPDASSGGLHLIHRILRAPLTAQTTAWLTTILNNLSDADPAKAMDKKRYVELATVAPDAAAGRFAVADFFVSRPAAAPGAPGGDAVGATDTIANLLSAIDPDVVAPGSAVPAIKAKLVSVSGTATVRADTLGLLNFVTSLPAGAAPAGADVLRRNVVAGLVQGTVGLPAARATWNLSHLMLAHNAMAPYDAALFNSFSALLTNLDPAAQVTWVQQHATINALNITALGYLLTIPGGVSANTHVRQILNAMAGTNPAPRADDVTRLWDELETKNYTIAADRTAANNILARIASMPANAFRKHLVLKLVGGVDAAGNLIAAQRYPVGGGLLGNGYLVENIVRGPIDAGTLANFKLFLDEQADDAGRKAVLDSNPGANDDMIRVLTDWDIAGNALGAAGRRLGVGGAIHASDSHLVPLLSLFLKNRANLRDIDNANLDWNRTEALANLMFNQAQPANPADRYPEFLPLFSNLAVGKEYLAWWGLNNAARAPAIKKIFDDGDADIRALLTIALFLAAIDEANAYARNNVAPLVGGQLQYAFANLTTLLANAAQYGLVVDHNLVVRDYNIAAPGAAADLRSGSVVWMLIREIQRDIAAHGDYPVMGGQTSNQKLGAMIAGLVNKLKPVITAPHWAAYLDRQSNPGNESTVDFVTNTWFPGNVPLARHWLQY